MHFLTLHSYLNTSILILIGGEMYSDKEKLKANIFEDFEKQESWQSYTTLLFADITIDDKKKPTTKK